MRAGSRLAALAVAAAAGLSACASLPTSGNIRLNTLHGSGAEPPLGVQVVPVPPGPGWSPQEIVRGFLAASASFAGKHTVAREYLTSSYSAKWRPGWAATVVASPAVTQTSLPKQVTAGGPPAAAVDVTGSYTAAMTTGAKYEAGNLVASGQPETFGFALMQVRGEWRIDGIYLHGRLEHRLLLLTKPDFETDYQPRNLYYFPAPNSSNPNSVASSAQGPPADVLIPEPVYIPEQASGKDAAVKGMVDSLLSNPPDTSWLAGAASTAFPRGTYLIGAHVSGVEAVVDLGGGAATATRDQLGWMAAQIYWSLTSAPYSSQSGNQIRSVVLEVNHRRWQQLLPPYDSTWVPRGKTARLYMQAAGGAGPEIKVVPSTGSAPVILPDGLSTGPFKAIAVTPGPQDQAVLAGCRGRHVDLVPQWSGGPVVKERLPAPCTSLSWDSQRDLWATAGGLVYELPRAGLGSPARTRVIRVACPAPSCAGTISSLRVAPDGVRAAMVVRSGSGSQVVIAAISNASLTYLGQTGRVVSVGSDITDPVALSWLDPDHLLVVGRSGGRSQIYEVPLTGGSSTPVATPEGTVTSIAVSWPNASDVPSIVVGVAGSAGQLGSVWKSSAGLLDRGWTLIAKGTTPVYPG